MIRVSWSISASGTAQEIRQAIRDHEETSLHSFPQSERLLAHHTLGHALSVAEEHDRIHGTEHRYVLIGNGSENHESGWCEISVGMHLDHGSTAGD